MVFSMSFGGNKLMKYLLNRLCNIVSFISLHPSRSTEITTQYRPESAINFNGDSNTRILFYSCRIHISLTRNNTNISFCRTIWHISTFMASYNTIMFNLWREYQSTVSCWFIFNESTELKLIVWLLINYMKKSMIHHETWIVVGLGFF